MGVGQNGFPGSFNGVLLLVFFIRFCKIPQGRVYIILYKYKTCIQGAIERPVHCFTVKESVFFFVNKKLLSLRSQRDRGFHSVVTVKILKFGTPQTIAIIVLKIEKFDVTLH